MLTKSIVGYGVAALAAYGIWFIVPRLIDENTPVAESQKIYWRVAQWCTTGFLWWTWLSHDMANIAVFLPREVSIPWMFTISVLFVAGLGYMLRERGGKIQELVLSKQNTRFIRSATIIDFVYWICLWFFKELNDIPMSTTWVFVGLLTGRELAIATISQRSTIKQVFPMVARDFMKMMIGLAASVGIVMGIQYIA